MEQIANPDVIRSKSSNDEHSNSMIEHSMHTQEIVLRRASCGALPSTGILKFAKRQHALRVLSFEQTCRRSSRLCSCAAPTRPLRSGSRAWTWPCRRDSGRNDALSLISSALASLLRTFSLLPFHALKAIVTIIENRSSRG